jgi:hypothetical protein
LRFVPKIVPSGKVKYGVRVFESIRLFQYWNPAVKLLIDFEDRIEVSVALARIRSDPVAIHRELLKDERLRLDKSAALHI